ncbi:hypothetical protein AB4084_25100, partial [Lysobacter sp. 2RAB21]
MPCWAVVPLGLAPAQLRAVQSALAECVGVRLLPGGYLQTAMREADGIVLVPGNDGLGAAPE